MVILFPCMYVHVQLYTLEIEYPSIVLEELDSNYLRFDNFGLFKRLHFEFVFNMNISYA